MHCWTSVVCRQSVKTIFHGYQDFTKGWYSLTEYIPDFNTLLYYLIIIWWITTVIINAQTSLLCICVLSASTSLSLESLQSLEIITFKQCIVCKMCFILFVQLHYCSKSLVRRSCYMCTLYWTHCWTCFCSISRHQLVTMTTDHHHHHTQLFLITLLVIPCI